MNLNFRKTTCIASIIGMLCSPALVQADESTEKSKILTGTTKEYLSDPARTGSLVGSIIAGSAVANPLAPLLGSVVGFMIGKSSAFSEDNSKESRRNAYLNRSLIPENGLETISLTGLTGESSLDSKLPVAAELPGSTEQENPLEQVKPTVALQSQGELIPDKPSEHTRPLVMAALPDETKLVDLSETSEQVMSLESIGETETEIGLQKQLASQCSNVQLSQPMPLTCYYYSQ